MGDKCNIVLRPSFVPEGEGLISGGQTAPVASMKKISSRKSRIRIYVVVAALLIASVATAEWFLRYDMLSFDAYTDKDHYLPGETMRVSAKFTNNGLFPVSLTFGTSTKAAFSVYSTNGSLICGIPMISMMVITHASIGPGKSIVFSTQWNQSYYSDSYQLTQLSYPNDFRIVAWTLCKEFNSTATTALFNVSNAS